MVETGKWYVKLGIYKIYSEGARFGQLGIRWLTTPHCSGPYRLAFPFPVGPAAINDWLEQ